MRYIQIFTISILLFSCSANKNVTTDLEKIGLKGTVKSLKFKHERNNSENENTYFIDNEFYFNQNGMISEQRQYSSEGLIRIDSFTYNAKNLLISKNYYSGSGEFVSKSIFENVLNNKGRLLKQSEYRALGNSVIDSTNLKFNPIPDQMTEFLYDPNGNLIKYNVYDRMSSFIKDVTELNNGEIVKNSTIVIEDGEIFSKSIYDCVEYDSKKNCIRYKVTENDSTESFINARIEYNK